MAGSTKLFGLGLGVLGLGMKVKGLVLRVLP